MVKSKIILEADAELEDTLAREVMGKIFTKIETLNERTKRQTIQIRELQREVKKLNARKK